MTRIGIGIDWGAQEHEVCALDENFKELGRWRVRHNGEALARLATDLGALCSEGDEMFIGIEIPDGPVVETMLERGLSVFAINPLQSDRFRERYKPSGAKDDCVDAWVLARTVLTDTDCFRLIEVKDPRTVALRECSRARDERVADRTRIRNRLGELLRRYFPSVLSVGRLDESWLQELLCRAPTPDKAKRVQRRTIAATLKSHRIRRVSADEVLAAFRQTSLVVDQALVETLAQRVVQLVEQLQLNHRQLGDCEKAIDVLLKDLKQPVDDETLSDAAILESLPGVGPVVLATMLGEATTAIQDRNLRRMRAVTGSAPVSILSGKHQNRHSDRKPPRVQMRRARSTRLANAMYHCARVAAMSSAPHKARYAAMRARGHTHGRACRQLGDQMLTVLFAMLRTKTLYQPPVLP